MKQSHGHYSTKGWRKHTVKSMEQRHGRHHGRHHGGHIIITLLEGYISTAHF